MDEVYLDKITYRFSQEGNTDGTTKTEGYEGFEELIVEVEGPVGSIITDGGYLVLRTPTGWSINDHSDLVGLLKIVENGVPLK